MCPCCPTPSGPPPLLLSPPSATKSLSTGHLPFSLRFLRFHVNLSHRSTPTPFEHSGDPTCSGMSTGVHCLTRISLGTTTPLRSAPPRVLTLQILAAPHPSPPSRSCRNLQWPPATTTQEPSPSNATASMSEPQLIVTPPLRYGSTTISTSGECSMSHRCSRCEPHRMYATGEPLPPAPPLRS
jgi:hypothetical protein